MKMDCPAPPTMIRHLTVEQAQNEAVQRNNAPGGRNRGRWYGMKCPFCVGQGHGVTVQISKREMRMRNPRTRERFARAAAARASKTAAGVDDPSPEARRTADRLRRKIGAR